MTLKINDNGINRDMTADEEAEYLALAEIGRANSEAQADAQAAKIAARQAVLNKLGLTTDEAAALLG